MDLLPPAKICVLVVDDEAPARLRIVDLLAQDNDFSEILEATNGEEAVIVISEREPDLMLLDVQMPELDGFGVLEAIGVEHMPVTVFVTAYDQHAIHPFEAGALDYLLKPFSDERMEAALARAKTRLNEQHLRHFGQRAARALAANYTGTRYLDRFAVKANGITRFVRSSEIDWIEAAGVYVSLHTEKKTYLYRASLSDLLAKLDPLLFVRVHRSAIINVESIVQLEQLSHGEFDIHLKHGSQTRGSRTYRPLLEKRLGQRL